MYKDNCNVNSASFLFGRLFKATHNSLLFWTSKTQKLSTSSILRSTSSRAGLLIVEMETMDIIPVFVSMEKLNLSLMIVVSTNTKKNLISHYKVNFEAGIHILLQIECVCTNF